MAVRAAFEQSRPPITAVTVTADHLARLDLSSLSSLLTSTHSSTSTSRGFRNVSTILFSSLALAASSMNLTVPVWPLAPIALTGDAGLAAALATALPSFLSTGGLRGVKVPLLACFTPLATAGFLLMVVIHCVYLG